MKNLEKTLTIINKESSQVTTIAKFSNLYYNLNILKKNITELEKKVRKKGSELMFDQDIKNISYKDYEIVKIDPTMTETYNVSSVIDGLGMERAMAFLKVDASITKYLKKASASGAITMEEVMKCRKNITKKPRMGYLKIQKKKNVR